MKRLVLVLVVLFTAATLFAGDGKSCNVKSAAKSVELTGTLASSGEGDDAKTVFRVANSSDSYTVCHKSKADVAKLSDGKATVRVTGKLVNCSGSQELVIENAKKI